MKFLIKYLFAMYGSVFILINNGLSFVDVVKSTLNPDTGVVRSYTKSIDKSTSYTASKLLKVKLLSVANEKGCENKDLDLPIQLMDETYKILMTAKTDSGTVMFDLNQLESLPEKLIVLSPSTANEIEVNTGAGYVELMVDEDEQLPYKIASKYLAKK
ncbi:MAG: hypothetical protein EBZ58_07885 [Bacteroidetes bacterium]|nr:hypothetical protein [Bacteroidota bacterium]